MDRLRRPGRGAAHRGDSRQWRFTGPDDGLHLQRPWEPDRRFRRGSRSRTFTYTTRNQLETEIHPERGTTSYTYDATGKLATVTDALGTVTKYGHDDNERLTCVDQSPYASPCSTLSRTTCGSATTPRTTAPRWRTRRSPARSSSTGRIGSRGGPTPSAGPSGPVPFVTSYAHDKRDNLELVTYPAPSTTAVRYQYDNGNRVIDVRQNGAPGAWASALPITRRALPSRSRRATASADQHHLHGPVLGRTS